MSGKTLKAFVFRNGVINLASNLPIAAVEIASGPDGVLSMCIAETAVTNSGQYLVPGIEAHTTNHDASNAVFDYCVTLNKQLARRLAEFGGLNEAAHSNQL